MLGCSDASMHAVSLWTSERLSCHTCLRRIDRLNVVLEESNDDLE